MKSPKILQNITNFETLGQVTTFHVSGFEQNLNVGENTSTISCDSQPRKGEAATLRKSKARKMRKEEQEGRSEAGGGREALEGTHLPD